MGLVVCVWWSTSQRADASSKGVIVTLANVLIRLTKMGSLPTDSLRSALDVAGHCVTSITFLLGYVAWEGRLVSQFVILCVT